MALKILKNSSEKYR